jgi:hypothetical protein
MRCDQGHQGRRQMLNDWDDATVCVWVQRLATGAPRRAIKEPELCRAE